MATSRESGRIKDANQKRVLDEAARRRRVRKALEALEQDNFHDDPHADLGMNIASDIEDNEPYLKLEYMFVFENIVHVMTAISE